MNNLHFKLEQDQIITYLIVVFAVILAILGVFIFLLFNKYVRSLHRRQKEALHNIVIGQERERERIARDLHDELSPELANTKFVVDSIETNDLKLKEQVKASLDLASQRLREISHNLASLSLQKYGLAEAIEDLLDEKQFENFETSFDSNCFNLKFDYKTKSNLFNVMQELLHNSVKYSKANKLNISLNTKNNRLILDFEDDGVGFIANSNVMDGLGMKNMNTRVQILGGSFQIDGTNGVKAKIVLNNVRYEQ